MTHRPSILLAGVIALAALPAKAAAPVFPTTPITDEVPATFPAGKTLVIPLTVDDPDGDPVTLTVNSSNPRVMARVRSGNFHYKMHVHTDDDGSVTGTPTPIDGEMEFQLFRHATPETAAFIAGFAQSGYYDDVRFHRVIEDFVIQGGDPAGTGSGTAPYAIRHEFRPELIYTGRGQLAMANSQGGYKQEFPNNGNFRYRTGSFSATNGSQFFVTLGQPRHLDFKHTLFGQLVRGFPTLDRLAAVKTSAGDVPVTPVVMSNHRVTASKTDAVLLLSASNTGNSVITVTARDPGGATTKRTFTVTANVDTINDPPLLLPFEPVVAPVGQLPSFSIRSFDLEHDAISSRFPVQDIFSGGNVIYAGINQGNLSAVARPDSGAWDITMGVSGLNDPLLETSPFDASRFETLEVGLGDKAIVATSRTIEGTVGTATGSVVLATFRHGSSGASPDDYIALVNWGDKSPLQNSAGSNPPITIVRSVENPGAFEVHASHTYGRPGVYPLHVTIDGPLGATATAKGWGVASPANAVLRAAGEEISFRGPQFGGRPVAYFSDTTAGAKPGDYSITIDWGDGHRTPGAVRQVEESRFAVFGTHRYLDAEAFSTAVHISRTAPDAEAVAWGRIELSDFEGPQHLPPFSKANITALWSIDPVKIYRGNPLNLIADIEGALFILNGGDKPTGKWKLKFWLSSNNTLERAIDKVVKIGSIARPQSELKLNSLSPGAGGQLTLTDNLTLRLPAQETGAGKYVIAELVYSDPLTDKMAVAKTIPFGPLTGIIVSPITSSTSPLILREDGSSNQAKTRFKVRLDTLPTADVTIPLDVTQNGAVTTTRVDLSKTQLVFTPANGTTDQEVEITAKDDLIQNSTDDLIVRLKAATSTDPRFNNMDGRDVALSIVDFTRNVVVTPTALTVKEGNPVQTFKVKLQTQPSGDVTVPLELVTEAGTVDTSRATLDKQQLVFTPTTGTTEQTVTVTAVNDELVNGNAIFKIRVLPAVSSDGNTDSYHGRDAADITLTVQDNDAHGITVTPLSLTAVEGGDLRTFTIKLNSLPTSEVTIPLEIVNSAGEVDNSRATINFSQLVFTPENGTTAQTVTVTAVDDAVHNTDSTFKIRVKPAIAANGNEQEYHNRDATDVDLTVQDNDSP